MSLDESVDNPQDAGELAATLIATAFWLCTDYGLNFTSVLQAAVRAAVQASIENSVKGKA